MSEASAAMATILVIEGKTDQHTALPSTNYYMYRKALSKSKRGYGAISTFKMLISGYYWTPRAKFADEGTTT
jgi:hypothetical protein